MMNLDYILKMEIKYLSLFSNQKQMTGGIRFQDDQQKDKYSHNLMMLHKDKVSLSELIDYEQKQCVEGFVNFRFEDTTDVSYQFLETYKKSIYGYYAAKIDELNIQVKNQADIKRVDPFNSNDFFEFLHQEDLEFGLSYAIGNVQRQKEVLQENQHRYIFLRLLHEQKVIGHINTFIDGNTAKIDEFYVIEDYQKKGFGSALMFQIIDLLKTNKVENVYLVTDLEDTAKQLYERYGFKLVGTYKQYQKMFT